MNIIIIILPAIITILGNIIFYLFIKGKIDNVIEQQKIAYSGIFKERIEIYKQLLQKIFTIKSQIGSYQYYSNMEDGEKIMKEINSFINYYLTNQLFISKKMLSELTNMRIEFQEVFEKFMIFHEVGISHETENKVRKKILEEYFSAGNKLKTNEPFQTIENSILLEMRKNLKTDKYI